MANKLQFKYYESETTYASPAKINKKAESLIAERNKRLGSLALGSIQY